MNGVYLIIGGNMGDRLALIQETVDRIDAKIGSILKKSRIYETAAWGKTDQPSFLNQVLYVHTSLTVFETLALCLEIEKQLGRVRGQKWESRLVDIDILYFNDDVVNQPNVKIPHAHLQDRRFVLVPLCEIAPDYIHPVFLKSNYELLARCDDRLDVLLFKA
jgi:2-amino-4-hydroxy-6-hydroxymethyldihydropteridine diphosphokinase